MRGFFHVLSVAEFTAVLREFPVLGAECVPLAEADGRVLAEAVHPDEDLPQNDRSCMDGYAVRAADLFGASETNPAYLDSVATLEITARPDFTLAPGQCAGVVTGGCPPPGADAVVMVEHTEDLGAGTIEVRRAVAPGENLMLRGEDFRVGDVALSAGSPLRPQEIGLLAALGVPRVWVARRPRVGVLATGDELVDVDAPVRPGLVRDVNTVTLASLARRAGAAPVVLGRVPDDASLLREAVEQGLSACDVLLLSGGSSVGVRDLTLDVLKDIGGMEILAHGVAISPGKPTILARQTTSDGVKAVWGLPGQVTSAQVVMHVLTCPFLAWIMGDAKAFSPERRLTRRAVLTRNTPSKPGREDYVRVVLSFPAEEERGGQGPGPGGGADDSLPRATPVLGKSGLLGTLLKAQGVIRIPAEEEGFLAGRAVDVWLF